MERREWRRRLRFPGRRRRAQVLDPDSFDLSRLDRLAHLVDRVIALLEQPRTRPRPEPHRRQARQEHLAGHEHEDCVLYVGGPSGYRLVVHEGSLPARGDRLLLAGRAYRVLRLGPSPLPADDRRCAFLETEDPAGPARTSDA